MLRNIFFVVAILSIINSNNNAQTIITDRPDFTESAFTLPSNSIQFEGGILFDINTDIKNITFPSILTRIALHRSFEVRIGFTGWTYSEETSETY